jgi:Flp pilus assembly protein TadG
MCRSVVNARRASAAAAAGARSTAHELHSQAASLKQAADAAHAAAALKIEVLHNMDSPSGLVRPVFEACS